jgi:hypothetical protein
LNVVNAIGQVGWKFGSDSDKRFNNKYWDALPFVKSGVLPSDAIGDLFSRNATAYWTGCNNTSLFILLKGILDTVGAQQFNASIPTTGGSMDGAALRTKLIRVDNVTPGDTQPTLKDWIPGDRGYIRGGTQGASRLAAGEWIIYKGNGKFWGFDGLTDGTPIPHDTDLPGMMQSVIDFSRGANETGVRWYPGVGLK